MRQILFLPILFTLFLMPCLGQKNRTNQNNKKPEAVKTAVTPTADHTEWISKILNQIQEIKIGITRAELLKVFTTEGGISTSSQRTYVYKGCPFIKVDVEFRVIKKIDKDRNGQVLINVEHDEDVITRISKPYLAWSILD